MSKTVLVTGGCGFIGSAFVQLLSRERHQWRIVNIDKLTYAGDPRNVSDLAEGDVYRFVRGDVADRELVHRLFEEERPQCVVHLAAESHVDRSIHDPVPFLQANVLGAQVLLEASRAFGVERFLYVSTDEVYGDVGADGTERSEVSPLQPSNPYSVSKAAADLMTQAYHRTYGLATLIVRPCNHYGPRQFVEKLIPLMIRCILRGEALPVYGDGRQRRDWLYVEDGAQALLALLERGTVGRAYNVAAHQERQNLDVVRLLCDLTASRLGCHPNEFLDRVRSVDDRPGHDFRYALDDEKVRRETGWAPRMTLTKGLGETVDWYLSHRDRLEHDLQ